MQGDEHEFTSDMTAFGPNKGLILMYDAFSVRSLVYCAMNYSVDDLVSSLASSHIGQEAIDLAALQVRSHLSHFRRRS